MDTLMAKVRVGESGQIVIPKKMRESLGIVPKENVNIAVREVGIVITPVKTSLAEFGRKMANECGLKKGEKILMGDELYEKIFSEKYGLR